MVKSLLGSEFVEHIVDVIPHDTRDPEDWEETADGYAIDLLNAVLLEGQNSSEAQILVLNTTDPEVTQDLETAENYSFLLAQTTRNIDETLKGSHANIEYY